MSEREPADVGQYASNWRRSALVFASVAVILAAALLLSVTLQGSETAANESAVGPSDSSAEAGFARDMQVHHAQAVEMALIVRDRTDDPIIRAIAYDIATAQQQQMGQMYAWLELWGLSQTSRRSPMAWMSAGMDETASQEDAAVSDMMLMPDGRMPGMATASNLARLRSLKGRAAEKLFLSLMIRHHEAGVVMAKSVLDLGQEPVVSAFADNVVTSQSSEIAQMKQLLKDRVGDSLTTG